MLPGNFKGTDTVPTFTKCCMAKLDGTPMRGHIDEARMAYQEKRFNTIVELLKGGATNHEAMLIMLQNKQLTYFSKTLGKARFYTICREARLFAGVAKKPTKQSVVMGLVVAGFTDAEIIEQTGCTKTYLFGAKLRAKYKPKRESKI